jgi:hypothetical protein
VSIRCMLSQHIHEPLTVQVKQPAIPQHRQQAASVLSCGPPTSGMGTAGARLGTAGEAGKLAGEDTGSEWLQVGR